MVDSTKLVIVIVCLGAFMAILGEAKRQGQPSPMAETISGSNFGSIRNPLTLQSPSASPTPTRDQVLEILQDGQYPGAIIDEDETFFIQNYSTSRCLNVDRGLTNTPANIITTVCRTYCTGPYANVKSSQWKLSLPGGAIGLGYMMHPQHTGHCGDIENASRKLGARFKQEGCDSSKQQQRFEIRRIKRESNEDWYAIVPIHSRGCLQATGGDTDPVEQANCDLSDNRILWRLIPTSSVIWGDRSSCPTQTPPNPSVPPNSRVVVQSLTVRPNTISLGDSFVLTITLNRPAEQAMTYAPNFESDGAEATLAPPYPIIVEIAKGSRTGSSRIQTQRTINAAKRINFYLKSGLDTIGDQLIIQ